MSLERSFPIWNDLTDGERKLLERSAVGRNAASGVILHNGSEDCVGVISVCSGQLRAYILSDEGKEVTLYRLFPHDICLLSASCMMKSIRFDVTLEVEKDAELQIIPANVYKSVMNGSAAVANYTNELMASRLSDVMWLVEQIMWRSFDKRLAAFLIEESRIDGGDELRITHERIAAHLGTAREVVTRMLKYFRDEGMVTLSRGAVEIRDRERLAALAE